MPEPCAERATPLDAEHIIRALARASHGRPHNSSALQTAVHMANALDDMGVVLFGRCSCDADGCDEEGDPGCAFCRFLDPEWPCPAEDEAPPHPGESCLPF